VTTAPGDVQQDVVTATTFQNVKQITIEESLGAGKNIARFPCSSTAFVP